MHEGVDKVIEEKKKELDRDERGRAEGLLIPMRRRSANERGEVDHAKPQ
jgi:hypothetical protein